MSNNLLEVRDLSCSLNTRDVLVRVSLSVSSGTCLVIAGPNGAGKSTLLAAICGTISSRTTRCSIEGDIYLCGQKLQDDSPIARRKLGLTLVPQRDNTFLDLTVSENLSLVSSLTEPSSSTSVLASIFETFPILKQHQARKAYQLSGGERQVLALSLGIASSPTILIVDEPTLGLSAASAEQVMIALSAIRHALGLTVIVVEHRLADLGGFAQELVVLREGRVAWSAPWPQVVDHEVLRNVYG